MRATRASVGRRGLPCKPRSNPFCRVTVAGVMWNLTIACSESRSGRTSCSAIVHWQLASRRAGSHNTQTRSEVSYSKRKVVQQKRTGSARHGQRSAGIFRHGGVSHGPKPRSHAMGLPKRIRRLGLCMALSSKAKSGDLVVLESVELAEGRSRLLRNSAVAPGARGTLVIAGQKVDGNFARAARNFAGLDVLPSVGANVYDILRRGPACSDPRGGYGSGGPSAMNATTRHYDLLRSRVVTEKSTLLSMNNALVFEVATDATKPRSARRWRRCSGSRS